MGKNFSERQGINKPKPLQTHGIDPALKNALWNAFDLYWECLRNDAEALNSRALDRLIGDIWVDFWKRTFDTMPGLSAQRRYGVDPDAVFRSGLREWYFHAGRAWNEIYDFFEFVSGVVTVERASGLLEFGINDALQKERSAFRFVANCFVAITNEAELATIRAASIAENTVLTPVSMHIQRATELFSSRQSPDYRNSMKESISAVESLCKLISGLPSATLSPALDKAQKELGLHPALQEGFKKIYNFASDAGGIRHGLKGDAEPEEEDAQFFLVACSAFVNYVIEKARKTGKLPA